MADAIEDDVLDTEIPIGEVEVPAGDQAEVQPPSGDDEDEVLIGFEGEEGAPPPSEEKDTNLVRHLREQLREEKRRRQDLERQHQIQPQTIEVGEKPTLAGCDYDEAQFEEQLDAWKERDAKAKAQVSEAQAAEQARQTAWTEKLAQLEAAKAKLGVKDFDQAEQEVRTTFNELQQAIIVKAAQAPEKMIYALGKNPAKAAELAKISDPVELIAALVRLEGKLTMTTRKAPPPEQIARGSAPLSNVSDKHLERLEAEAARTGDRTKVVQYKRELKAKARS